MFLKIVFTCEPANATAATATRAMSAMSNAYSSKSCPSSLLRSRRRPLMMRFMTFSARLDDAQYRVCDIRSCFLARPRDAESNRNRRATHPDPAWRPTRKVADLRGFSARKLPTLCLEFRAASTSVGGTFVTARANLVRSGPCQNGALVRGFLRDFAQSGRGSALDQRFSTDRRVASPSGTTIAS